MPGSGTKPPPPHASQPPALTAALGGALTPAGQIAQAYTALRLGRPAAPAPTAVPSPSRARAARQLALQGARLAQSGRYAAAIERFRESVDLDPTVAAVQHDLGVACQHAERLDDAVTAFRRAAQLDPTFLSAHRNLASVLMLLQRDIEALASFDALAALDPTQDLVQAQRARILMRLGRQEDAAARFREAAAAIAGTPRAGIYEAFALRVLGQLDAAEVRIRATIATAPELGEAHVMLAQLLGETGRGEEAAASAERGVTLDPSLLPAWNILSMSKKFTAGDQPLIARMEADARRPGVEPALRMPVHFALGKAYDDLRDWPAAIHHFDAANAIRKAHARFNAAQLAAQTDRVIASSPPGFHVQRPDLATDDPTPILIVGMPRSGTTLVEQILSSHPRVAAGGELAFWRAHDSTAGLGTFGPNANAAAARRLAAQYLAVLRGISPDAARVTDKMPFNFAHLGVIRQILPQATFVHCRRNPIDTCLSIYFTNFESSFDFASDRRHLVSFYREYRRLMAHWRAVLPHDRFIEVDYETLVADPEPLTRAMVAACGLPWDDACLAPHRNQRQIATASLWQARQPIYRTSVERWRRYEPWIGELRLLLDDEGAAHPVAD